MTDTPASGVASDADDPRAGDAPRASDAATASSDTRNASDTRAGNASDTCPDLALLEATPRDTAVRAHIDGCPSCALVAELFDRVAGGALDVADCAQFDALLAARTDGTLARAGLNLLERHLAGCADCRAVAETLSPTADTEGDHAALPNVDPAGYALGLEIARGGMGRVLAARDLRVGRPVAVKELLGRSPQLAARFEREARVTARLQHPGIVPIYEIGKWPDGTPFYSMRMVDGRTLRDALAAAPTLPERLALLPALISAASAVAFAHAQRVIHRDLTPANVIVGAYGETVVIDWGLAKDLTTDEETDSDDPYRSSTSGHSLTNVGAVIGTAPYMPPEQAHAQPVDERADVYALGAILYHLLAGVAPYEGPTTAALLRAVKTGPPRAIDTVVTGAPRDLVSIADKAMARNPELRYPSARELAEELERFRTGRMVEAHEYSTRDRVRRFVRRHRAAVITTLAAAVVLAIVAGLAVTRVVRSNKAARTTVRDLLLEKGRVELLEGDTLRALAYLDEARRQGDRSPALDFLLGAAVRSAQDAPATLDCGGMVRHLEFSPDRVRFAAACTDVGKIWRLDGEHAEVASLARFPGGFKGIAYSHDGNTLVTWGQDGIARLWDAHTGALRASFEHGAEITVGSFTPDDAILATTGHDGMARIWDVATGRQLRAIEAGAGLMRHTYGLIGGDGKNVLTITIEGEGNGWDLATGARRGGFTHGGQISGGQLSLDGSRAITCGMDHLAKVWDATTSGDPIVTLPGHTDVMWKCAFSPDATYAITSGHDRRTNIWALPSGTLVRTIVHDDIAWTGEIAPDNSRFTTVTLDGKVKVWDLDSGALLATHDSARGKDARFSLDGHQLVVQRGDGRLQIWTDSTTRRGTLAARRQTILGVDDAGLVVATSSNGTLDGQITLHDLSTGRPLAPASLFEPIAFGGGRIAATGTDGIAIVGTDGANITTLPSVHGEHLVMAENGERIAIAINATRWEVWDVARKTRIATLDGAQLLLSADGQRAVTWREGERGPLVTWDVDRGAQLASLAPSAIARPIGFSRDGHRVVVVEAPLAREQSLSIWNADTGAVVLAAANNSEIQIGDTQTNAVPTIDSGGRFVTTIRADHRVTVWNIDDGRARTSFVGDYLQYAQVRADGALIAAIGEYGNAAIVLDADGRKLARWAIANASPSISEIDFTPPQATARWSPDGSAVITRTALEVSAWRASNDDIARVGAVVRKSVPYRVVDGRLELVRNGRLHGTIERGGSPVARATVSIEIRIVPELKASSQSWEGVIMKIARRTTQTDANGAFSLAGLVPGTYSLTVTDGGRSSDPISVMVSADDDPIPTIQLPAP